MRRLCLFSLVAFVCFTVSAQKVSLDQFKNLKARNIGPAGMSGRITSIDAVHKNIRMLLKKINRVFSLL